MKRKKKAVKETVEQSEQTITVLTAVEQELIREMSSKVRGEEYIVAIAGGNGSSPASEEQSPDQIGEHENLVDHSSLKSQLDGYKRVVNLNLAAAESACRSWKKKQKVGLLCVNNVHIYEDLKDIVYQWKEHLSPRGRMIVCSADQPGPKKVIKETTGEIGNFELMESRDNTVIIGVDGCTHHWMIGADEIGTCRYCGRTRNFRKLMRHSMASQARKRSKK
jgi:hypothetical protein